MSREPGGRMWVAFLLLTFSATPELFLWETRGQVLKVTTTSGSEAERLLACDNSITAASQVAVACLNASFSSDFVEAEGHWNTVFVLLRALTTNKFETVLMSCVISNPFRFVGICWKIQQLLSPHIALQPVLGKLVQIQNTRRREGDTNKLACLEFTLSASANTLTVWV